MLMRRIKMDRGFLHIPVKLNGARRTMQIWCGNALIREFYLAIAEDGDGAYFFLDLHSFQGCALTVVLPESEGLTDKALLGIRTGGDAVPGNPLYPSLYREALRPQFHFSSRRGWLNDPNGLVFAGGLYHLYYQHNPLGVTHGGVNISWGHAVSEDLIHWEERSDAILPWRRDWLIASGSALVDSGNAAGCGKDAIVAAFTALGTYDDKTGGEFPSGGQFMAASPDGGDSFYLLSTQAAVPAQGGQSWRDPRIFRYRDHFVMAVYETEGGKNCVSFYTSKDLRRWTKTSSSPDLFECPDLFPLKTEGGEEKWVLYGADGLARIGDFDGSAFHESGISHPLDYGDATYAGQTWNQQPRGERIHISWCGRWGENGEGSGYDGMPFSQCMTIPCELTLSRRENGYRVLRNPVPGLAQLREAAPERGRLDGTEQTPVAVAPQSDCSFEIGAISGVLELRAGKHSIRFDAGSGTLSFENGRSCRLTGKELKFRLLADTTTMEFFFADGIACTYMRKPEDRSLTIAGRAQVRYTKWALRSIWPGR